MAGPLALVWDLIATDNASEVFSRVGKEAGAAGKETESLGAKFSKFGGVIALAGAALTVVAAKMAMDMQETTAKIQGNAQITQKAAVGIGDAFLATAGKSTFSGKSMAEAFAPVAGVVQTLAGHTLTAADAMTVMNAATMLAEASGQPLAATTADLAAVMQSFGIKLSGASEASNVLFNTSRLTNVGLDTLAGTVDKLHAKLGIASPTLAETSALIDDLAIHGISGSRGLMVVNTAMTTLLGGSKGTSAELKTLGMNVFDSSGKFVGMKGVLEQLTPKLKDMTQQQQLAAEKALFGGAASKALNSTLLAGVDGYAKATAAVTKHGAAEDAAKAAANTLAGQMKTLKAAFSDVMVMIGEKVIPVVEKIVSWFETHKAVTIALAGVIGGVLLAAVIDFAAGMVAATWPILAVIAAIAALAAGAKYAYGHFKWFKDAVDGIKDAVGGLVSAFQKGGLSGLFAKIGDDISKAKPMIKLRLEEWAKAFVDWVGPATVSLLKELGKLLVKLGDWIWFTALPWIGKHLLEWGKAFIGWIGPMIPPFLVEIGKLEVALGKWMLTVALPAIYKKLREWGDAFWKWVPGAAKDLLEEMGKLIAKWDKWLVTTALPWLVKKLGDWAKAFKDWVPGAAKDMVEEMGKLLAKWDTWMLTKAGPWLVKKLAEWAKAFADWVPGAALGMIEALGKLWAKMSIWMLTTALPAIIKNLAKWADSFLRWVTDVIVSLPGKLASVLGVITSWAVSVPSAIKAGIGDLGTLLAQKGKDVMHGFLTGLTVGWTIVKDFIKTIAPWLQLNKGPLSLDASLLVPHGHAIMNGFLTGLKAKYANVTSFISGIAGHIGGTLSGIGSAFTGGGGSSAPSGTNQALGHSMMLAGGWGEGQWTALDALWNRESGWSATALNASSGAFGIPQSLPGNKMAAAGADWQTNAMTQIAWGLGYIRDRYGSPIGAMVHENQFGWYDNGGMMMPGGVGKNFGNLPERVMSGDQTQWFEAGVAAAGGGRGKSGATNTITNNIYETVSAQATAMQVSRRQAALGAV